MTSKEKILNIFKMKEFKKWESRARQYTEDKEKGNDLLEKAMKKAKKEDNNSLKEIWENVQLLFKLFRDWLSGKYTNISKSSITMVIIGLVYFVSPIDITPDFIAGLGLFDDAVVLGFVIDQIKNELEKYKVWKEDTDKD